ncbi:MAG: Rieske 2Fe-2S domain-containing protein [Actinomycetota bacterium]|nr:Rieske 2Fe-2S domain-containing protein [Actinomycetota bacterium]
MNSVTETVESLVQRLGHATALDRVAKPLGDAVSKLVEPRSRKDLLSGTWLGHPLHPMLTDVPIGFWTSALVLDLLGGKSSRKASDALIAVGVVAALPTAAAGLSDWSDTLGEERRIGVAHAGGNVVALACYTTSLVLRRRGKRVKGVAVSLLGAAAATVGGYLGGHLAYRNGVNVDRNAWRHGSDEWTDLVSEAELGAGEPAVVQVGDENVLLLRDSAGIVAIGDVCSHAGGPLHEGSVADGCVTCPWHGSVFRLADGGVVHGPATGPQPAYDVRVIGGRVSVRRRRGPSLR